MALGYSPSQHRKRAKNYADSTLLTLKSFKKAIESGNCVAARGSLVEASITAGAAYAEDFDVGRRKKRSISSHPSIKAVRAAKNVMIKACPMKKAKKSSATFKKMSMAEAKKIDALIKAAKAGRIKGAKVGTF